MDKILKLYVERGVESTPFPNSDNPIEIGEFRYDAKRMGGAPTISATVMYPTCLDDEWNDNVYAVFNGEKYYLKQIPTSSYSSDDARYKHSVELISERVVLDNVYFFDTVIDNQQESDKPASNSTKVVFFGTITEFAKRLKASLAYSGIDYDVIVDDDPRITTESKLISFENQFFSNVLQEIYNTYEAPYYFEAHTDIYGVNHKSIHIGYSNMDSFVPTFEYGVDNALVSISKNNANYKVVTRASGVGSTENIPYYYPNNSPKGEITATPSGPNFSVAIIDHELYSDKIELGGVIIRSNVDYENLKVSHLNETIFSGESFSAKMGAGGISKSFYVTFDTKDIGELAVDFASKVTKFTLKEEVIQDYYFEIRYYVSLRTKDGQTVFSSDRLDSIEGLRLPITKAGDGYNLSIDVYYAATGNYVGKGGSIVYDAYFNFGSKSEWTYEGKTVELGDIGLKVSGSPASGDAITQNLVKYVNSSQRLMPSIYRKTDGAERFYNAINGIYDGHMFKNPFVEGRPKEHIVTIDDIKPTIKGAKNAWNQSMDLFVDFEYDDDDNDETEEANDSSNRDYVHSYFFAKLRRLDFNLFDHAIENQPMTIEFTSGDCGACKFEVGVTEGFPQLNPVILGEDGRPKKVNGRVVCGQFEQINEDDCQPEQQDTINNEVWIALKKEDSTYGILMPKAPKRNDRGELIEAGHRPSKEDTFVITGINLPKEYITKAEKRLEEEIIQYLKDNNEEKFKFSINFSRIFFEESEENRNILRNLSENSKIQIIYNNKPYDLYVSSFSYSMSEGDVLPEIKVELDDTLQVTQNALQSTINEVKSQLGAVASTLSSQVAMQRSAFIQRQTDDEAYGMVNFTKGIKFGEGGKVEILDNNSAKLTIEYLEVTKKASFTSLEIQEKTHVGGQLLVTPAAINCAEVDEFGAFYRCYFQTKGPNGDEIFNQFAVGDQAICQTFNAWGVKYYWRLVTGVGEDYIDLSKTDCDPDSGIPSEGDKIIQLGNREDKERQNAIVIAAYGDGSPYIIQYKGIDGYEISDDKIITKLSSTENIFTGKVHMEMGSDGLENINGGLNIGGQNLLRNSGFTGDYLSEPIADETVMKTTKKLFSDPLDHWNDEESGSVGAKVINLSGFAASGFGVNLSEEGARLNQTLYYGLIAEESYTLSFKAIGSVIETKIDEETGKEIEVYNTITCVVGDFVEEVKLTGEWEKYVIKVVPTMQSNNFSLVGEGIDICDIQLERGTIATAWSASPLDNSSDRAYWQSLKYIEDATKGATDIYGGLVLTHHIKVGERIKSEEENVEDTFVEHGGMNGEWTSDDSPAFWAGGSFDKAIDAVSKFTSNPKYKPTESELANMAKFVITHGGRAILNDIIMRGYVYAKGGTLGENTTIENDIIKTKAIELSDYVVYKYRSIEDVCNGGVTSSSYSLPYGASSYISYDPGAHQISGATLHLPDTYERGRTITIVCSPITGKNNVPLSLSGDLYLVGDTIEGKMTERVSSVTVFGGKIELFFDGLSWLVLTKLGGTTVES